MEKVHLYVIAHYNLEFQSLSLRQFTRSFLLNGHNQWEELPFGGAPQIGA